MTGRKSQIYLAYDTAAEESSSHCDDDAYVTDLPREDAAEYIAALLGSLRAIAAKAQFRILSDLLSVAEEEAKLHFRTR